LFLLKTFKALNGFLCADVPLRNYSLTLNLLRPWLCTAKVHVCCSNAMVRSLEAQKVLQVELLQILGYFLQINNLPVCESMALSCW